MRRTAKNQRHYEDHEICLIWQVHPDKVNAEILADHLGRTSSAIKWLWRLCDEVATKGLEGIGPRSSKLLASQIHLWGVTRLKKRRGCLFLYSPGAES